MTGQIYPHLQIICVNDGSKGHSQEILEEYVKKDSRIVPVVKENECLSSARNQGLEAAAGEYVMFLDSDDWLDRDICRQDVETMEEFQTQSKPADVLGKERLNFDEAVVCRLYRRLFGLVGEELADPSKGDVIVTAWGKLYRRELIEGIEFIDTKKIGTEDCLYNVEVFRNLRSLVYLPVYCSMYNYILLPWILERTFEKTNCKGHHADRYGVLYGLLLLPNACRLGSLIREVHYAKSKYHNGNIQCW